MTQLYKAFQSSVSISLDLCVCHHKMLSNQIFSIRQKCWMPPNFSASLLMNITILDFQSGPNTSCSEFRLPMTQLYIIFQSNVNFSLDSCIGYHKMWSNQIFSIRQMLNAPKLFCFITNRYSQFWIFTLAAILTAQNLSCRWHNYIKFFSWMNVSISLDLCICHLKMWSDQISSIRQKCWMPSKSSASSLINITILDFQFGFCSEFRLPMTQLYKVFQSNLSISLDLCIGHHKMWSNQSLIN